jgi:hypothetical protein
LSRAASRDPDGASRRQSLIRYYRLIDRDNQIVSVRFTEGWVVMPFFLILGSMNARWDAFVNDYDKPLIMWWVRGL